MDRVFLSLPARYEGGIRTSLAGDVEFAVTDHEPGRVTIAPREGAGVVREYFRVDKIADATVDIGADEPWAPLAVHPPISPKPPVALTPEMAAQYEKLHATPGLPAFAERLGVEVALTEVEGLPDLFRRELPALFERYANGSLWYFSVDRALMKRLTFMRIALALALAPDAPFGDDRIGVTYFGAHQLTSGVSFCEAVRPVLLAFSPVASGFAMNAPPHAFVFLFGEFEDLRTHSPGPLARQFFPPVNAHRAVPGIKVPVDSLAIAHVEALLGWWATRLNILYSHAADPTRFATDAGEHDAAAQAAWFFTFERLLADMQALAAAVDAPGLLRMQGAFDALDKAGSLLTPPGDSDARAFRRLLRRSETLPRLRAAFQLLPVQLQARFSTWAELAFDRLYADIAEQTMTVRRREGGVLVGHSNPTDLREVSWDDYVSDLVREARNASHGLLNMLTEPARRGRRPRRYLLATNQGEVPASLYEVTRAIVFALIADPQALCDRSW